MASEEIEREWKAEQEYLLRDALLGRTGEMARRYGQDAEFRHGIDLMARTLPHVVEALAKTCDEHAIIRRKLIEGPLSAPGLEF